MLFKINKKIRKKEIPKELNHDNSLFVILGNSILPQDRTMPLPGVIHDIANLKKIFLSKYIGFSESNIITLLNTEKQTIIENLNKNIHKKEWDNIILYYSGFGLTNHNGEFYITCGTPDSNETNTNITAKEIGAIFKKTESNIVLIFDCCYAQKTFEYLYNKDVFLLGATNEGGTAQDTPQGELFTKSLVEILTNGIDNNSGFLSLNDIYMEMRRKLIDIQKPEMLTTNIVQYQLLSKNRFQFTKQKVEEKIKLKSKNQISNLIRNNKLKEAFQQLSILLSKYDETLKNSLILFENRYKRLKTEVLLGLIGKDVSDIENNKIVYGLLQLMQEV